MNEERAAIAAELVSHLAEGTLPPDCEVVVEAIGRGHAVWFISDGFEGWDTERRAAETVAYLIQVRGLDFASHDVWACDGMTHAEQAALLAAGERRFERPDYAY